MKGLVWVLLCFALTGLLPGGTSSEGALAAAPSPPKPKGEVVIAPHFTITPDFFDPIQTTGSSSQWTVYYALHDALIKSMPGNPMALSLAEKWSVSPDGKVYEFKIREGVKFHNGDPLTAEDVKFTFERFKGLFAESLKQKVARIEIVNPLLIRFVLKAAWPDFMTYYAGTAVTGANWIVPKNYIGKVGDVGFQKNPVGAGPYRFVRFKSGEELVLEAYEQYWRKMPNVKTIRMKLVPEASTRFAMVQTGEADISFYLKGALQHKARNDPKLQFSPSPSPSIFYLVPHDQWVPKSPWADVRVRKAVSLAMNRKMMVETTDYGAGITGGICPNDFLYTLRIEPDPYDPKKAKALLAEAGYPNGFDAGVLNGQSMFPETLDIIANYLQAVGVRVKVKKWEKAAYHTAMVKGQMTGLALDSTGAGGTAVTRLERAMDTMGKGRYPDIDALWEKQKTEVNEKKRTAMLHDIQRLMHEKMIFISLHHNSCPMAITLRVKDYCLQKAPGCWWPCPVEDITLAEK